MTSEEKESRFDTLSLYLKKRNLMKGRELLFENLSLYADDKDFLNDCYHLGLKDSLILQKHNDEILDYKLDHWDEERYPDLLADLKRNFSRKRYHLAMELATYFHNKKIKQNEQDNELEIELKPTKKKKPKKTKRVIPLQEKYLITGITTTTMLLIGMIIQLIIEYES